MLSIQDLHVSVEQKPILRGVDLIVQPGEIHAIMGPNGGGKSTLAYTLAGHPRYIVENGSVTLDGESLLDKTPDERARAGLFLAFQYPVEIPGVPVQQFLRLAYEARFGRLPSVLEFRKHIQAEAEALGIPLALLERGLNEGFSGGEKKRVEILQMAILKPKIAILDETDSGLDVDALRAVSIGAQRIAKEHKMGVIIITHYQRILNELSPDHVHVMAQGKLVTSGAAELAKEIEQNGYAKYTKES